MKVKRNICEYKLALTPAVVYLLAWNGWPYLPWPLECTIYLPQSQVKCFQSQGLTLLFWLPCLQLLAINMSKMSSLSELFKLISYFGPAALATGPVQVLTLWTKLQLSTKASVQTGSKPDVGQLLIQSGVKTWKDCEICRFWGMEGKLLRRHAKETRVVFPQATRENTKST